MMERTAVSGGTRMDQQWKKYLPPVCAGTGGALLVFTAVACMGLDQGGWLDRAGIAAVLIALAVLSLLLLRMEGVRGDALLILLLPIGAAMVLRALSLDYISGDYVSFLKHWAEFFRTYGGFSTLASNVGNYNVPYLYYIAFMSYIGVPDLYMYKLLSILFDVVLAWGCFRLVRSLTRDRQGSGAPLTAFAAALLLPVVVLNGAYWGQCDVIYGALAIHAAALVLEGKNKTSVALMAVAFSFKLQAVFVLPLWGVLWLAKKVRFWELWVFPVTYLATILPAVFLGKPLADILGIYFNQMTEVPHLVLNAASVYQFIPRALHEGLAEGKLASALGIAAAAALVLVLLGLGFWLKDRLDRDIAMTMAVILCIGVPFFLPHMHERYFFLADVFTLCWACANVRCLPVAVLAGGASLASYVVYLRQKYNFIVTIGSAQFGMALEALAMLGALAISVWVLVRQLRQVNRQGELT